MMNNTINTDKMECGRCRTQQWFDRFVELDTEAWVCEHCAVELSED